LPRLALAVDQRLGLLQLRIQELDASGGKLHIETGGFKLQVSNVEKHRSTPYPDRAKP